MPTIMANKAGEQSRQKPQATAGALALAATTTVLRGLLENGLARARANTQVDGDIIVSALPPDRITLGTEERPQINLYLLQVHPSAALPRGSFRLHEAAGPGEEAHGQALGLELNYLLTVYAPQDLQAELLLGHVLRLFHATPEMSGEAVQALLTSAADAAGHGVGSGTPGATTRQALAGSDLVRQIALRRAGPLKLTLQFSTLEEMARIWSLLQAPYRPSVLVKVTAVFIETNADAGSPL